MCRIKVEPLKTAITHFLCFRAGNGDSTCRQTFRREQTAQAPSTLLSHRRKDPDFTPEALAALVYSQLSCRLRPLRHSRPASPAQVGHCQTNLRQTGCENRFVILEQKWNNMLLTPHALAFDWPLISQDSQMGFVDWWFSETWWPHSGPSYYRRTKCFEAASFSVIMCHIRAPVAFLVRNPWGVVKYCRACSHTPQWGF